MGNTDASFPHAVEDKKGQVQDFPKTLKLELPLTIMRNRISLPE